MTEFYYIRKKQWVRFKTFTGKIQEEKHRLLSRLFQDSKFKIQDSRLGKLGEFAMDNYQ
jgi:hypothetical protein